MDRKDQAVKNTVVDAGIIKLDQSVTDVQNKITATGEAMHKYQELADKCCTDFEGLRSKTLGQVSAESATLPVKVESRSQVMGRINAAERILTKADNVVDKMGNPQRQMNL